MVQGTGRGQEYPALEAGIDRSYIEGLERGRNLSFKKLCALAKVLECDVASLIRGLPLKKESFE